MVAMNNKVDFLFRKSHAAPQVQDKNKIPLLDIDKRTFAGVEIRDLNSKIEPAQRKAIETAVSRLEFTVEYTKGDGWANSEYIDSDSVNFFQS